MIKKKGGREVLFEIGIYLLSVLIVSFLWRDNTTTIVILAALWIVAMIFWHDQRDLMIFIVAAIAGPLGEIIAIRFGVWSYANPTFLGIPLWLPLLWGFFAMMLSKVATTIKYVEKKR